MDLFETKSSRGLERRVDEEDLRNLYRAGFIHLDSPVRRSGSPTWFRVEEMFPQFEKIAAARKYSANFKVQRKGWGSRTALLIIFLIVLLIVLLVRLSQNMAAVHARGSSSAESSGTLREMV